MGPGTLQVCGERHVLLVGGQIVCVCVCLAGSGVVRPGVLQFLGVRVYYGKYYGGFSWNLDTGTWCVVLVVARLG